MIALLQSGKKPILKMDDDEYLVVDLEKSAEIKVKGSKFIGTVFPVTDEKDAKKRILTISQELHDATHHCYAYTVGFHPSIITRFNDDGEPSGTAGLPILNVINGKNLSNTLVVVTRYFGGVKLGKGGLIRAYSDCTKNVLNLCTFHKKRIHRICNLIFDYEFTGSVMQIISQWHAHILDSNYEQKTQLKVSIRRSKYEKMKLALTDATSARIQIEQVG